MSRPWVVARAVQPPPLTDAAVPPTCCVSRRRRRQQAAKNRSLRTSIVTLPTIARAFLTLTRLAVACKPRRRGWSDVIVKGSNLAFAAKDEGLRHRRIASSVTFCIGASRMSSSRRRPTASRTSASAMRRRQRMDISLSYVD